MTDLETKLTEENEALRIRLAEETARADRHSDEIDQILAIVVESNHNLNDFICETVWPEECNEEEEDGEPEEED